MLVGAKLTCASALRCATAHTYARLADGATDGGLLMLNYPAPRYTRVDVPLGGALRVSAARVGFGLAASLARGGEFNITFSSLVLVLGIQFDVLGSFPAPSELVLHFDDGTLLSVPNITESVLDFPDPPIVRRLTFKDGDVGLQFLSLART